MTSVTVRRQGDSFDLSVPFEIQARLGLEDGQQLTIIELTDGFKLVKHDPALDRQMTLAEEVLSEQAGVLQQLSRR